MVNGPLLTERTGIELAASIGDGDVTPTELVEAHLDRINEHDGELNAYVTVTEELARKTAQKAEERPNGSDDTGPLHGVPVALKDGAFLKEGIRHTNGSPVFAEAGFEAPRTSVVTKRLERAGAIIIGKTNLPAFGHKAMTENAVAGATANPFDTTTNAGGSSGGSAAAVAAGLAPIATGSDAGGSIRIPAALCGVFGLKPSFGLVPWDRRPVAFGRKTHHAVLGPITRTVEDAAVLMEVMTGPHPSDPSSCPVDIDYQDAIDRPVEGLRVAYSPDLGLFDVGDEVGDLTGETVGVLQDAGASVEQVSIEHDLDREELADALIATFADELAGGLAVLEETTEFDVRGHPDTAESLHILLDIADDLDDNEVALTGLPRTRLFDAIQGIFEEYDLLVTPTLGRVGIDRHHPPDEHLEWVRRYVLAWPFNFTGHPAASVPAGLTDDGLPVGIQVVGRRYADDTVLTASAAIERERPWQDLLPL